MRTKEDPSRMGSNSEMKNHKPHVVCIPYPAQGHINPFTKLAMLLHHRGFHITFVHTDYNYRRLLRTNGSDSLVDLPSFRFKTIPDGLPPVDADVTQDTSALCASMDKNGAPPFKALLEELRAAASDKGDLPPVTCVISDSGLPFTLDVTKEMGIVNVQFWAASACAALCFTQCGTLLEKGFIPVEDNHLSLDTVIESVPQPLEGICLKDMPSFITTSDTYMRNFTMHVITKSSQAAAIIFNTFEALEGQILSYMAPNFPPLYPLGPLQLFHDQINKEDETVSLVKSNLWNEDNKCIDWLNSKESGSVIYVNFGSITLMTSDQLVEFAWGLANSEKAFLWIIRSDVVSEEPVILPADFVVQTKQRGLLASWCDQERILKHSAIGGFLTHSGWNSTLESIGNGVPMICWPFFADQQTNCWYCQKLGIATKIDNKVKREEVSRQVKELMDGERGMEMKRKSKEWKKLAYEAVSLKGTGESRSNLDRLINEVLSSKLIS